MMLADLPEKCEDWVVLQRRNQVYLSIMPLFLVGLYSEEEEMVYAMELQLGFIMTVFLYQLNKHEFHFIVAMHYMENLFIINLFSTSIRIFSHPKTWLLDSTTSHHVTDDLHNLSLTLAYEGPDAIVIGDGTGLTITHTRNSSLSANSKLFTLSNVLCIPSIEKNLLSVSRFCKTNNTYVEFFPAFFLVKDLRMRATLVHDRNNHDVYE